MKKLIVFDMEGTLIENEFLAELAKLVGKEKEIKKITIEGLEGKINWEEGFRRRVKLLTGVDFQTARKMAKDVRLCGGAKEIVRFAHKHGYKACGISGGFDIMAEIVKRKLGLDFIAANSFLVKDGKIAGAKLNGSKEKWMLKLKKMFKAEIVIAIGDGANDMNMINKADYGIRIKHSKIKLYKRKIEKMIMEAEDKIGGC